MVAFDYISIDKEGQRHKGVIEADSMRHARQLLREQSLAPLSLQEASGTKYNAKSRTKRGGSTRIGLRELSILTCQLATLIESGLPVELALQALSRQSQNPQTKSMMAAIRAQVMEGHTLAKSLETFPRSFSELYCASVAAGERTGHLAHVLLYLSEFTENLYKTRQKILLALLYPAILTVVSLLIIAFLLAYIVPGMIRVFSDTGHALPFLTRALIATSDGVQHYGLFMLLGVLGGALLGHQWLKRPEARLRCDRTLLQVPLVGTLIFEYNASRFASTLGMLQESGVPLVQGLEIVAAVMSNRHVQAQVGDIARKVREGISLSAAMEKSGVFSPILITMTASGEASGKLGSMLVRASATVQRDLENRVSFLLGIFEPLVLLLMGGIVLLLVLAIILPILNLNQLIK